MKTLSESNSIANAQLIATKLAGKGISVFPITVVANIEGKWCKKPACAHGHLDASTDLAKFDPWTGNAVGVPIPEQIVVIDVDIHKGATTTAIEQALGCAFEWNQAKLQDTVSGGAHYAFRIPKDVEIKQGSDLCNINGFDTRSHGKGWIATGENYITCEDGLEAMADIIELPELPVNAVKRLKVGTRKRLAQPPIITIPLGEKPKDYDNVKSALDAIDPACRDTWVQIGMALKSWWLGSLELYDQWSSGGGDKYKGIEDVQSTWNSFKRENGVGLKTLYYLARKDGWVGDAASIFGNEDAGRQFEVKGFQPIEALGVKSLPGLTGDHLMDAMLILSITFDNRLVNLDGELYYFNGHAHEKVKDKIIRRYIGRAMGAGDVKVTQNRIAGTLAVIKDQALELGKPNPLCRNVYFTDLVRNAETGEYFLHKIENRNTFTLSVESRGSTCPQFMDFMCSIFRSDPEQIKLMQEALGWSLIRDNLGIEKAVLFIGPPRAGKGVIARLLFTLLGSGAVPFNLSELDDNKRLSGMRQANIAIDTDAVGASSRNARSVTGVFKIVTSNEKISVLQLYTQTPWEGSLNCKMFVLANSVPTMWDDSAATANRWVPIVFSQSFLGKEKPDLFKQLLTELPGIAAWAVEGLRRLIARGHFELPQSSQDQLDSLISEGGSIQDFIGECLVLDEQQRCSDSTLWDVYRCWVTGSGREMNKRHYMLKSLEDALRGNGVRRAKSVKLPDGKFYRGFYGVGVNFDVAATNITPLAVPVR